MSVPASPASGSRPSSLLGEPTSHAPEPRPAPPRVVIDHQGPGKVTHKPDGTVVWEPASEVADRPAGNAKMTVSETVNGLLVVGVFVHAMMATMMSVTLGMSAAQEELDLARRKGFCLTSRHLTTVVAHTVSSCMAGMIVGTVTGPLVAVRMLGGILARPAAVALGVHGVTSWVRRHRTGVVSLIKKLQCGDLAKQLEALRSIITQAMRSADFSKEFNKFAGIELLLKQLMDVFPDSPLLHLLVMALGELVKDNDCKESLVAAGGVPRLVSLLSHPNASVCERALGVLVRLSDHPLAQDAIREAGGVPRLVEMAATPMSPAAAAAHVLRTPADGAVMPAPAAAVAAANCMPLSAVSLLGALALDPANKLAIGASNGVEALLGVIKSAPPRSQLQMEAVVALHNVLRGSPDNQRALAVVPGAAEVLRSVLSLCGPSWFPAKADLHALLNVLARMAGTHEMSGFVVLAPANADVHAAPSTGSRQ